MKGILFSIGVVGLLLTSCAKEKASTPVASNAVLTPTQQGKNLVEHADCISCHKTDGNLVGPSYKEIAAKYTQADVEKLADKIISGGSGSWGTVAMTPHLGISKKDAESMVEYILSLK